MDIQEQHHLILLSEGNKKSFIFLHRKYQAQVYHFCLRFVRSKELAQEITSDVFLKLWQKRMVIQTDQSISGLLFKITRDISISYLRKVSNDTKLRKEFVAHYFQSLGNTVEEQLFVKEGIQIAKVAIDRLPPRCRQVFQLRYTQDLTLKQIAEKLNISTSTVKKHLQKGTQLVKAHLEANADLAFSMFLLSIL